MQVLKKCSISLQVTVTKFLIKHWGSSSGCVVFVYKAASQSSRSSKTSVWTKWKERERAKKKHFCSISSRDVRPEMSGFSPSEATWDTKRHGDRVRWTQACTGADNLLTPSGSLTALHSYLQLCWLLCFTFKLLGMAGDVKMSLKITRRP